MNNTINCLVVDDEPVARRIIRNYSSHLPFLNIVAECGNAFEAREKIITHDINLVFLDIQMPVLTGTEFLSTMKNAPQVIFTTAYQEYAVKAFDLAACDYLVKPFSLERFIIAVDKAKEKLLQPVKPGAGNAGTHDYLLVKAEGKLYKVLYSHCLYAEAQANYTKVVTRDKILLTKMSFTEFDRLLPQTLFIRVHRSFIVNMNEVNYIEGNIVMIHHQRVPIAAGYKEAFLKAIAH